MLGGIACWFMPLFHVQPLGGSASDAGGSPAAAGRPRVADPADYVRLLWDGPLRTGDASTDIKQLWDAFAADASQARSRFGQQAGLGGAWYFCIRGQGVVAMVEKDRVVLTVPDCSSRVCVELGGVVDNTVREAVGVKASEFANSQEFNAISSDLNLKVESEIIAPNRPLLKPGVQVDFVGCARIGGESDLDPLCLIPIRLEVASQQESVAASADESRGGTPP
ncbi:hypothetical protein Q31a_35290 [Aureliella helgolandensis]|uniref:DUF2291 domain-containing protein n=2 Tax=Aureliella helgolandensis TaxID=2527968 RepID=A0A518G9D9_9BACT|nr:hypothetical protein Q31a_35290 [Aureliella helgolandensis]